MSVPRPSKIKHGNESVLLNSFDSGDFYNYDSSLKRANNPNTNQEIDSIYNILGSVDAITPQFRQLVVNRITDSFRNRASKTQEKIRAIEDLLGRLPDKTIEEIYNQGNSEGVSKTKYNNTVGIRLTQEGFNLPPLENPRRVERGADTSTALNIEEHTSPTPIPPEEGRTVIDQLVDENIARRDIIEETVEPSIPDIEDIRETLGSVEEFDRIINETAEQLRIDDLERQYEDLLIRRDDIRESFVELYAGLMTSEAEDERAAERAEIDAELQETLDQAVGEEPNAVQIAQAEKAGVEVVKAVDDAKENIKVTNDDTQGGFEVDEDPTVEEALGNARDVAEGNPELELDFVERMDQLLQEDPTDEEIEARFGDIDINEENNEAVEEPADIDRVRENTLEQNLNTDSSEKITNVSQGPVRDTGAASIHPRALEVMFGSSDWDNQLTESIRRAEYSGERINKSIDCIIEKMGCELLVFEREHDGDINEMIEVWQLLYCWQRNLQRGDRAPRASVRIGDLTKVSNMLGASSQPQVNIPSQAAVNPDINNPDLPNVVASDERSKKPSISNINVSSSRAIVDKRSKKNAKIQQDALKRQSQRRRDLSALSTANRNIVDAYDNSGFDWRNKPIMNQEIVKATLKQPTGPIIGHRSIKDPTDSNPVKVQQVPMPRIVRTKGRFRC